MHLKKKLAAPTVGAEVAAAVAGNSVVQDAVEALVALWLWKYRISEGSAFRESGRTYGCGDGSESCA